LAPKLLFVVARQRSGTNLLRNTLQKAEGVLDLGEVCQEINMGRPASFLSWVRNNQGSYPDYILRKTGSIERVFKGYVQYLYDTYPDEKLLILDIKYDHLGLFNSWVHYPLQMPMLFDMIREGDHALIHLTRSNLVESYLSNAVATARNAWVAFNQENVPGGKVTLKLGNMLPQLEARAEEMEKCQAWAQQSGAKALEVEYAHILDENGQLSRDIIDWVHTTIDPSIAFPEDMAAATKKLVNDYSETVENYDEVLELLKGTKFAKLLKKPRRRTKKD